MRFLYPFSSGNSESRKKPWWQLDSLSDRQAFACPGLRCVCSHKSWVWGLSWAMSRRRRRRKLQIRTVCVLQLWAFSPTLLASPLPTALALIDLLPLPTPGIQSRQAPLIIVFSLLSALFFPCFFAGQPYSFLPPLDPNVPQPKMLSEPEVRANPAQRTSTLRARRRKQY